MEVCRLGNIIRWSYILKKYNCIKIVEGGGQEVLRYGADAKLKLILKTGNI